ncbi:MAG: Rid family hydrolase [Candidatus Ratteibacteria bacterium]|jgi:enamine deaminase RidA (YjgF/YER057c/UK114 family)
MGPFFFEDTTPSVSTRISCFYGTEGTEEYHCTITPRSQEKFSSQLEIVETAYKKALSSLNLLPHSAIFRRFFCAKLYRNAPYLLTKNFSNPYAPDTPCAISWIEQPLCTGGQIALWAYHIKDPSSSLKKKNEASSLILTRNSTTHYWSVGVIGSKGNTGDQTRTILEEYRSFLTRHHMRLRDNTIRTWFFIQNIDQQYQDFVRARKIFFCEEGLTEKSHFIASTGIEGSHILPSTQVTMDAYSISGLLNNQISFLHAPAYLSPTHLYGVTFERAVSISYQDRMHLIISGTASINKKGKILYPGNVARQLSRTLTNINALLREKNGALANVLLFIVYIRNQEDSSTVEKKMHALFPKTPIITVLSRVCRPGWLVEIEAIAIIPATNPSFSPF